MTVSTLDFMIKIDRSAPVLYPDWVLEVLHPELEGEGPAEYNLDELFHFSHENESQEVGVDNNEIRGNDIYENFKKNGELVNNIGLADLLAIQAKGVEVFRQLFGNNVVFGWRSVVRGRLGLLAPCLYEREGKVILKWGNLDHIWKALNDPESDD